MQVALKNLKQDDTITILPADKGRASVVLDTNIYHNKMKTLIETGPYRLLNKDRTERLSRKLTDKLLSLKQIGHLSETNYNKIKQGTNSHLGSIAYLRYTSPTHH